MAFFGKLCGLLFFNFLIVKGYLSNSPHIITFWGQDPALQDADKVVRALDKTCGKSSYSTVVIGFVNKSFKNKTTASLPPMHCVKSEKSKSKLSLYCPEVAKRVQQCQKNKRKVLIGVGGPNETLYFDDAKSAQYFAKKIWNWFLGGTEVSDMRPFGGMKLDGVNLFLKDSDSKHLDVFLNTLNKLSSDQKQDDKYTYTMSVPCNNPDLYFGDGKTKLSRDKIVPLIKQVYVRYAGKPCCKDGPTHFRSELHNWKQFSADPKRPELFVLFPRNPHKTMTNCFSSNRQLSILHNMMKLKRNLGDYIEKAKKSYLKKAENLIRTKHAAVMGKIRSVVASENHHLTNISTRDDFEKIFARKDAEHAQIDEHGIGLSDAQKRTNENDSKLFQLNKNIVLFRAKLKKDKEANSLLKKLSSSLANTTIASSSSQQDTPLDINEAITMKLAEGQNDTSDEIENEEEDNEKSPTEDEFPPQHKIILNDVPLGSSSEKVSENNEDKKNKNKTSHFEDEVGEEENKEKNRTKNLKEEKEEEDKFRSAEQQSLKVAKQVEIHLNDMDERPINNLAKNPEKIDLVSEKINMKNETPIDISTKSDFKKKVKEEEEKEAVDDEVATKLYNDLYENNKKSDQDVENKALNDANETPKNESVVIKQIASNHNQMEAGDADAGNNLGSEIKEKSKTEQQVHHEGDDEDIDISEFDQPDNVDADTEKGSGGGVEHHNNTLNDKNKKMTSNIKEGNNAGVVGSEVPLQQPQPGSGGIKKIEKSHNSKNIRVVNTNQPHQTLQQTLNSHPPGHTAAVLTLNFPKTQGETHLTIQASHAKLRKHVRPDTIKEKHVPINEVIVRKLVHQKLKRNRRKRMFHCRRHHNQKLCIRSISINFIDGRKKNNARESKLDYKPSTGDPENKVSAFTGSSNQLFSNNSNNLNKSDNPNKSVKSDTKGIDVKVQSIKVKPFVNHTHPVLSGDNNTPQITSVKFSKQIEKNVKANPEYLNSIKLDKSINNTVGTLLPVRPDGDEESNKVVKLKSKLANVISKIESLYLTNERRRAKMNVSDIFSSRDKIGRTENHNPEDDILQPIKRLFTNPNFTALYKKMNQLEMKISEKEDKFLFDKPYTKRNSFSIGGGSPKHAMITKLLKQIQHTADPVKKSQIRLVVDIFTDENSKAALKKLNLDKVDVNVDRALSKKGAETHTSLLRKETSVPTISSSRKLNAVAAAAADAAKDKSEDPDASHFRRRNNYTPPSNDLEVAGNDDVTTSELPQVAKFAANIEGRPRVKGKRLLRRNRTRTHITGPFPMLFDTWEKLENQIDPLPIRKLDKYENNSQRSLQETIGDNQSSHSKSIITLDNDLLNPDSTVEIAEEKVKIAKPNTKDYLLDDMFVSDVDGGHESDDVSSYGSEESMKSFLEIGTQEDSQIRSKIRKKNHRRTQKLLNIEDSSINQETAGVTTGTGSDKTPLIKVAIRLVDPTKPLHDEEQFNIVSMESKKNLGPRMNNDSMEQTGPYVESNEEAHVDKSKLNMKTNETGETKETNEANGTSEAKEPSETKEGNETKEAIEAREASETKDTSESKETSETKDAGEVSETNTSNQFSEEQQKTPAEADMNLKETPGVTGSKEAASSLPSDNVQFTEPSKPVPQRRHTRHRRRKHKQHHVREHVDPLESTSLQMSEDLGAQKRQTQQTHQKTVGIVHRHQSHRRKRKKITKHPVTEAEIERTSANIENPLDGLMPAISVNKTLLIEAKKRFTENIYKTLSRFIPLEFNPSSESRLNDDDSANNDADAANNDGDSLRQSSDLLPVTEQDNDVLSGNALSNVEESRRQKVKTAKHHRKSNLPKPSAKKHLTNADIVTDDDKFQRKVDWLKEELARLSPSHNKPLARRHDDNSRKISVVDSATKTAPINTWYFDSLFTSMYGDLKRKLTKLKHMKSSKRVSEKSIKKMVATIDKEIEDISEKADTHASQALIKKPTHTAGQIGELELGPVIDYFDYVDNKRQDKTKQHKHKRPFSPLKGKHMVIGSDAFRNKNKETGEEEAVDKETVKTPKENSKEVESANTTVTTEAPEPAKNTPEPAVNAPESSAEAPEASDTVGSTAEVSEADNSTSLLSSAPQLNLTYSVSGASIASSALTNANSSYITPYHYPVSPAAYPPPAEYDPNNANNYQNQVPLTRNNPPQAELEANVDSENRDSGPMSTAKVAKQNAASKTAEKSSKLSGKAAKAATGQVTAVKPSELSDPIASKIAAALTNTQLPPGHPGNSETLGEDHIRDEAMNTLNSERDPHITEEAMSYLNTDGMIDQHPPFDQIVSIGENKDDSEEDPYLYSNHDAVIDFNYLNDTNYPKQPYAYSNSHAQIDFPKGKRSVNAGEEDEGKTHDQKVDGNPKTVKMDKILLQFSKMFPPSLDPFAELERSLSNIGENEKNN